MVDNGLPPLCPSSGGGEGGYLPTADKAAKSSESGLYMPYMSISGFFTNFGGTVASRGCVII